MEFAEKYAIFDNPDVMVPHAKMGILGGTFNPIHNGHIEMALNIREEFGLRRVILLPTGKPPHKQDEKSELATAQQRLHMARLAASGMSELEVSDREVQRKGLSYTVDTMNQLKEESKDVDYYFIIGSDSLFELESWMDFKTLSQLTHFICVKRKEDSNLSIIAEAKRLSETYGTVIEISQYSGLYVSSSYIRKRIQQGKNISAFVAPAVEEYIVGTKLYK